MGGLEFMPYDQKATAAFFKAKAEEEKKEAEKAKKAKKGGGKAKDAAGAQAAQKKPAAAQQEEEKKEPKAAKAPVQEIKFGTAVPQISDDMKDLFNALEVQLEGHQYLGGQKPSAADREAIDKI